VSATSPPTLAQAICLLALSRGEQPAIIPPVTRRELLRKHWITPSGRIPGDVVKRTHEITDAGRVALAASQHLGEAQRKLDAGKRELPWR
jgi:hypothetical protein